MNLNQFTLLVIVFLFACNMIGSKVQYTHVDNSQADYLVRYVSPIHAFDNIETTDCTVDIEGQHLCDLTYYGIKGAFPIAGNPRLRDSECDCVLGMRLQESENIEFDTDEEKVYPKDDWVFVNYFKSLIGTLMYGSEGGQIRNINDEQRTVEFYSTVKAGQREFDTLSKRRYNLEEDALSYSIEVADFSTPVIDSLRDRRDLAIVKNFLMAEAGRRMEKFINKHN